MLRKTVTIGNIDRQQPFECDVEYSTCTETYMIEEIFVHENYTEGNARHDIGIIKLSHDINYTGEWQAN